MRSVEARSGKQRQIVLENISEAEVFFHAFECERVVEKSHFRQLLIGVKAIFACRDPIVRPVLEAFHCGKRLVEICGAFERGRRGRLRPAVVEEIVAKQVEVNMGRQRAPLEVARIVRFATGNLGGRQTGPEPLPEFTDCPEAIELSVERRVFVFIRLQPCVA